MTRSETEQRLMDDTEEVDVGTLSEDEMAQRSRESLKAARFAAGSGLLLFVPAVLLCWLAVSLPSHWSNVLLFISGVIAGTGTFLFFVLAVGALRERSDEKRRWHMMNPPESWRSAELNNGRF